MALVVIDFVFAFALVVGARGIVDVRLVDAVGSISSVGLLQVKTDMGFGTVCGANAATADVISVHRLTHMCSRSCTVSRTKMFSFAELCVLIPNANQRGDLQIPGLCQRFNQQLIVQVLRWYRFVWC